MFIRKHWGIFESLFALPFTLRKKNEIQSVIFKKFPSNNSLKGFMLHSLPTMLTDGFAGEFSSPPPFIIVHSDKLPPPTQYNVGSWRDYCFSLNFAPTGRGGEVQ